MSPSPEKATKLTGLFGIDSRALAVFRIALGVLLLADLAIRATDLRAMYTDEGILSVAQCQIDYGQWRWSLHWLSGSWSFAVGMFVVAGLLAGTLVLGFCTRAATILSWILLCSLQFRLPTVLNGGDVLLRLLLFWGMFLPLGRVWSVDARRAGKTTTPQVVVSLATAAVMLQIVLVVWFTGIAKLNEVWLGFDPARAGELLSDPARIQFGGPALSHILSETIGARPWAGVLLGYPTLLQWLSLATVILQVIGPWLLFYPWRTRSFRLAMVACFIALHVGVEASIHVGLFSYVSLAGWILFLPSRFWSALFSRKLRGASEPGQDPAVESAEQPGSTNQASGPLLWVCRFGSNLVCLGFLLLVAAWNVTGILHEDSRGEVRESLTPVVRTTMTDQLWGTVYARPAAEDHWYVYRAFLADGSEVDILRGGAPAKMAKPARFAAVFPNHRWRTMHRAMVDRDYRDFRRAVARYLMRRWNDRHGPRRQILRLQMICLKERLDGREPRYAWSMFAELRTKLPEFLPPPRVEPDG